MREIKHYLTNSHDIPGNYVFNEFFRKAMIYGEVSCHIE
jgi:hypothetical protein